MIRIISDLKARTTDLIPVFMFNVVCDRFPGTKIIEVWPTFAHNSTESGPSSTTLTLESFRNTLVQKGIIDRQNDCLYYIDDENDLIPIESEMEFTEVLKFGETINQRNGNNVTLIVGERANTIKKKSEELQSTKHPVDPVEIVKDSAETEEESVIFVEETNNAATKTQDLVDEKVLDFLRKFMDHAKKDMINEITHGVMEKVYGMEQMMQQSIETNSVNPKCKISSDVICTNKSPITNNRRVTIKLSNKKDYSNSKALKHLTSELETAIYKIIKNEYPLIPSVDFILSKLDNGFKTKCLRNRGISINDLIKNCISSFKCKASSKMLYTHNIKEPQSLYSRKVVTESESASNYNSIRLVKIDLRQSDQEILDKLQSKLRKLRANDSASHQFEKSPQKEVIGSEQKKKKLLETQSHKKLYRYYPLSTPYSPLKTATKIEESGNEQIKSNEKSEMKSSYPKLYEYMPLQMSNTVPFTYFPTADDDDDDEDDDKICSENKKAKTSETLQQDKNNHENIQKNKERSRSEKIARLEAALNYESRWGYPEFDSKMHQKNSEKMKFNSRSEMVSSKIKKIQKYVPLKINLSQKHIDSVKSRQSIIDKINLDFNLELPAHVSTQESADEKRENLKKFLSRCDDEITAYIKKSKEAKIIQPIEQEHLQTSGQESSHKIEENNISKPIVNQNIETPTDLLNSEWEDEAFDAIYLKDEDFDDIFNEKDKNQESSFELISESPCSCENDPNPNSDPEIEESEINQFGSKDIEQHEIVIGDKVTDKAVIKNFLEKQKKILEENYGVDIQEEEDDGYSVIKFTLRNGKEAIGNKDNKSGKKIPVNVESIDKNKQDKENNKLIDEDVESKEEEIRDEEFKTQINVESSSSSSSSSSSTSSSTTSSKSNINIDETTDSRQKSSNTYSSSTNHNVPSWNNSPPTFTHASSYSSAPRHTSFGQNFSHSSYFRNPTSLFGSRNPFTPHNAPPTPPPPPPPPPPQSHDFPGQNSCFIVDANGYTYLSQDFTNNYANIVYTAATQGALWAAYDVLKEINRKKKE